MFFRLLQNENVNSRSDLKFAKALHVRPHCAMACCYAVVHPCSSQVSVHRKCPLVYLLAVTKCTVAITNNAITKAIPITKISFVPVLLLLTSMSELNRERRFNILSNVFIA